MKRLAWAIVAVALGLVLVDTSVTAQYRTLMSAETISQHAWPSVHLAALASTVMGALIVSRYPRHPIGWLLAAGGSATCLSLAMEAVSLWATDHDGPGSVAAGRTVGWLSLFINASFTLTTLVAIFLLAPDGRLASRRWRIPLWAAVAAYLLYAAAVLLVDPQDVRLAGGQDQDHGVLTAVLASSGILLTALSLVAAVVSLVLRRRRAVGVVRQQLRWVVAAAALPVVGLAVVLVGSAFSSSYLLNVPLYLSYLAVPVCIAVAVLHHRLFDLDLIISRALVLAIATLTVGSGYVVVVVLLSSAIGRGTAGFWPSLLAFVLVAIAFQPLRRRVVRLADHLAFGASATPYEALADFARRLGDSPDPTKLLPAVADAAGSAVNAQRTTVRLSVPGGADQVVRWSAAEPSDGDGQPAGSRTEVPVLDRDEQLGSITVDMPPGRSLRPHDAGLLRALAEQAGIAFRNAQLAADLANQVTELDRRTGELIESRRRLITAADAERARLERSIARDVVPHLEPLPGLLAALSRDGVDGRVGPRLEPLLAEATIALEELRQITRGVFPAQLARSGLEPALRSLLGRLGSATLTVDLDGARRFDGRVEAAAYFCVAEAVRDLRPPIEVRVRYLGGRLELLVGGGGGGELSIDQLRDRVESADGTVSQEREGAATMLRIGFPAPPQATATPRTPAPAAVPT